MSAGAPGPDDRPDHPDLITAGTFTAGPGGSATGPGPDSRPGPICNSKLPLRQYQLMPSWRLLTSNSKRFIQSSFGASASAGPDLPTCRRAGAGIGVVFESCMEADDQMADAGPKVAVHVPGL